jgi:hypothetical protein
MLLRRIAVVKIDRPHKFIYIAAGDLMDFWRGGVDEGYVFRAMNPFDFYCLLRGCGELKYPICLKFRHVCDRLKWLNQVYEELLVSS